MKNYQAILPVRSHRKCNSMCLNNTSANKFTFSKASRFPYPKENDDPSYVLLPSTLSKKTCGFGYGKRWEPKSTHCQDSPSPNRYVLRSIFGIDNRGIDYSKQIAKERELFYIKPVPGPGSYNPSSPKRKKSPSCFIIGKKHYRSGSCSPDPGTYTPNYLSQLKRIVSSCSFTKAKRKDSIVPHEESPGPGMYEVNLHYSKNSWTTPVRFSKTSLKNS